MKIRTFHPDINKFFVLYSQECPVAASAGPFATSGSITSSPVTPPYYATTPHDAQHSLQMYKQVIEKSQPKCDFFFDFG